MSFLPSVVMSSRGRPLRASARWAERDMETALIGSDPPSSEYQYEPEESDVFNSDEEVLAPDSDPPVMDGMEVDADLATEGRPIDVGLGDESALGNGDLDDLMAGLSGRSQESRQPAAATGSTGVDRPIDLPDDVNESPNDEEVISAPADDSRSSQATSTDFASLMASLAGDMDVDESGSPRARPRTSTNHVSPRRASDRPLITNGQVERMYALEIEDRLRLEEGLEAMRVDRFSGSITHGDSSVRPLSRVRGDHGDMDVGDWDSLCRGLAASPVPGSPLFLRSSSPTTLPSRSASPEVEMLDSPDGMTTRISAITIFVSYRSVDGRGGVYVERGIQVELPENGQTVPFSVLLNQCREGGNRTGRLVERLLRGSTVFYVGTNIKPVPLEDVLATPASQIAYQEVGILTRVINDAENFIPAAPCMDCEEKETISAAAASTGDVEPCYVLYLSPEEEVDITARTADEGRAVSVSPNGTAV
ncbi:hypothetical protein ARMSODRAFT_1028462, partial [Armillaria solidipes]